MLSVDALCRPVVIVLAVKALGPTPQSVMFAYLALAGVTLLVVTKGMTREGTQRMVIEPRKKQELIRAIRAFGVPLLPLAFVSWLTGQSDRYIVGAFVSIAATGSYAATYGLISQPFVMTQGIMVRILQPHLIHAVTEGNRPRERQVMVVWVLLVGVICLCGFAAIYLLRRWIVYLLLASEYRADALPLIPWIAGGYCLFAIGTSMENLLYARRQTHLVVIGESIVGAAAFVAPLVMVHFKGLLGAAMACPIYFGILAVVMFLFITRFAPPVQRPSTSKSE